MGGSQSDRAKRRLAAAARRQRELEVLRIRLAAGERLSKADLDEAALGLAAARQRAAEADSSARVAHRAAATAHLRAASVNEGAGLTAKAQQHRTAATRDLEESAAARDLEESGEQTG
jgi:hypothetical protein